MADRRKLLDAAAVELGKHEVVRHGDGCSCGWSPQQPSVKRVNTHIANEVIDAYFDAVAPTL